VDDNDSTGVFIANVVIVETPHPTKSTWMLINFADILTYKYTGCAK